MAPTINGLACRVPGGVTATARSASPDRTSFSTRCKTRSIGRRVTPARWTSTRPCAARSISSGRVERVSYEKLAGRVDYDAQRLTIDLRLDQAPGVWLTATGTVPVSL